MAEEILSEARKGTFDLNPRLRRKVVCEKCGSSKREFIQYLKSGEFEVGSPQRVLVAQPGYYYALTYEEEAVTPIFITVKCEKCAVERKITDPVLTVEYLRGIARYKETSLTYI